MAITEFECKKCGGCCINLRGRGIKKLSENSDYWFRIVPSSMLTIGMFDWEASNLKVAALKQSFELKVRPVFLAYDKKSDTTFTYLWNLDYDNCPFFVQNSCSVNSFKPLICQNYPLLVSNLFAPKDLTRELATGDCPHIVDNLYADGKNRQVVYSKVFPYLFSIYGDSFLAALKNELIVANIKRTIGLISENRLALPAPVPKTMIKAVLQRKAEPVTFVEFLSKISPDIADQFGEKITEIIREPKDEFKKIVYSVHLVNNLLINQFIY